MTPSLDPDGAEDNPQYRDRELIERMAAGDEDAATELQRVHSGLIHAAVERYGRGLETEDAVATASLALHEATLIYEPDRTGGANFPTLAYHHMRARLRDARNLARDYRGRLGHDQQLRAALSDVMPEWAQDGLNQRPPTAEELATAAARAGMTLASAEAIIAHQQRAQPITTVTGNNDEPNASDETFEEGDSAWAEPELDAVTAAIISGRADAVRAARATLPDELRAVVDRYYPLTESGRDSQSIQTIADELGMSKEGARKRLGKAIELVRANPNVRRWE